ncbi:E3 ubiquitin-protein ligase PRT6 [Morus notabilis]|uniref:E3 ubiquitin-protein ligase PRT6 n=1 Tax=Morus notabilis TaxID=981085 RepID=UPI000CECE5ED|nr:E3 ubiquitin-protein ligase PRT6 [Morus notabilis]
MDIDSPPESAPTSLKPRDRIVRRLAVVGVFEELLDQNQRGLVAFVKDNKARIPEVVSAVLPSDEDVAEFISEAKPGSRRQSLAPTMKNRFRESISWLQWLMFEGEPVSALRKLSRLSVGQRGVCGAVWGQSDIAYRCKTCEHDPTCAICVPCFQNGNHNNHDYSVIYTSGGCCDCGDVTAWKKEGFCSKHKGAEQIQPLPAEFADSVGPVLDALFNSWRKKLLLAETTSQEITRTSDRVTECKKSASELTFVIVEMLLEFCKQSESLLSFISKRVCSSSGLLEILVRGEGFLHESVVKKLHELLLKLLGEPTFKYEFSKVFLSYYPTVVSEIVKECNDGGMKKHQLLSIFSVQIFTVPTLTPRLVKEMNLLSMLLGCLGDIFFSCASEDGRLQVAKWGRLNEITLRVVEDIRFVMSHAVVPSYVTKDQQDVTKTWLRLLTYVQGMNPQKREMGLHIEDENEYMHLPFLLGHSIANIHSLLVDGAFSVANEEADYEIVLKTYEQDTDGDNLRHSKVGRLSQESSACSAIGRSSSVSTPNAEDKLDYFSNALIPPSVTCLTHECLRAIENWLAVDNTSGALLGAWSPSTSNICSSNFSALRKTLTKFRKGRYILGKLAGLSEDQGGQGSSHVHSGFRFSVNSQNGKSTGLVIGESGSVNAQTPASFDDSAVEGHGAMDLDALRVLSLSDWPDIVYDVSSQDISVHIPLHRFLSLLLQKALRRCFGESVVPNIVTASSPLMLSAIHTDFFGQILNGCHPYGFSAFAMEHPLRIRVFCAEVHAGMWRKNGDAALLSCEWYRSVRWSEQGLEHDLFLLQCCAAMAPADPYIHRILERFGLSSYLSLNLECCSEYEPVLVQEMLTLIIHIVKERRFSGLTKAESLKRELIYKLAIGDFTHSQLVKSLPHDLSKFEQLQEILDAVAVYSNPSGFNQGTYSLRWTFWNELDLYHPRWNSRDLQVAEERYLRFCGASALTSQLPRWSKVYPPLKRIAKVATCRAVLQIIRSVLFYAVFTDRTTESRAPDSVLLASLHLLSLSLDICVQHRESNDLSCYDGDSIPMLAFAGEEINEGLNYGAGEQSLLSLLVLLMRMHKNENPENFLDTGSCNLSSLIESLLKKFAEIDPGCMAKLQQLAPEVVSHLSQAFPSADVNTSKSASDSEKRKAKARERQAAILEKMRAEQAKFLASIDSTVDDGSKSDQEASHPDVENKPEESTQIVCSLCHDANSESPVSFLILLQKSRLLSFVDRDPPSWEHPPKLDEIAMAMNKRTERPGVDTFSSGFGPMPSSELAQFVQNAATEFASYAQPSERVNFLEFLKGQLPELGIQVPSVAHLEKERTVHLFETSEEDMYLSIQREVQENTVSSSFGKDVKLLTTEESLARRKLADSLFLGKYVASFWRGMEETPSASDSSRVDRGVKESMQLPAYDGFGPTDCDGIFLSSCGHAVHQGCLDRYLHSLKERFVRRIVFEGGHIVDPDQGEFLCPVCRRLANSILPALPGESQKILKQPHDSSARLPHAPGPSYKSSEEINLLHLHQGLALLQSAANVASSVESLNKCFPHQNYQRIIGPNLQPVSRVLSKMYFSSRQDKFLRSLRVSPPLLMWDVLKYSLQSMEIAARCGRTHTTPTYCLDALYKELESSSGFMLSLLLKVVQSTRRENSVLVLQRFGGIQSFAYSICPAGSVDHNGNACGPGNWLRFLNNIDKDVSYPDIQFWNRASEPILARDPFSSLMWTLFCLPYPFLSCQDSLLHLIHVFYAVSVVQATITYFGKHQGNISEFDGHDCLTTDILKLMKESRFAQQYFVSNYSGPSGDIKSVIRRLTFPYLRRCALLWKLLTSSARAPFYDRDNALDRTQSISDLIDSTDSGWMELNEVERLENMFKIPPVEFMLKDELLHSLSSQWLKHFSKEFEVQRFRRNIHCNPVVPFQLMHLPRIYQDLLQRCIKQSCPDCNKVLDEPALCLLCGRLCSPNWKSCCRESGCQTHAMACGAGTGIFLLIKKTTILLQRSARQAPWPSLYLDAFGEEDIEMHRGKPLYLNEERYAALTYMVASHGLDRSSRVLGQTTIGSFFMV